MRLFVSVFLISLMSDAALAQGAAPQAPSLVESLMPLVLIFAVFYFLVIRPQQRKIKTHAGMIADLQRNDKVLTGGGIIGKVTKVCDDNMLEVEIASGVTVKILTGTITEKLDAGTKLVAATKTPKKKKSA